MDFKVLADLIENGLPFQKMLGIRVGSIEEGRVRLFIPFREDLIGDARQPAIHGGVISTLADVCAGFAVWCVTRDSSPPPLASAGATSGFPWARDSARRRTCGQGRPGAGYNICM